MPTPWERDLEADRRRLTAWLGRVLPDTRDLSISELTTPQATGFSNDTLLFDATWRQAGRRQTRGLVARVEPTGFQVFPEYDLALQYRVLELLAASDVPVPRVHWLEAEDTSVLGAPFFVMERVDGRIPTDSPPYHVGGWMTGVEPAEREAIWWNGLEVMTRIHRLDWRASGFDFLERPELGPPGLGQQLEYYERYLSWAARGKPQPTVQPALEWLIKHRPQDEPLGICWGDARIGNIIFDGTTPVAVLDWEMVTLGNPEQDLAWWLFLDRHHSEGMSAPRLPGFPGRDETLARYAELTGRPVEHLSYYEVFAGFRFAVIMLRLAQQMLEYGRLPADSDFETNNTVTRLLAKLLDLPDPADAGA